MSSTHQPSPSSGWMPAPPQMSPLPSQKNHSEFNFGGMLWRGKWLLILAIACGLGIAYWKFTREIPLYQSSANILIAKSQANLPIQGLETNADYRSDLETQIVLLKSTKIIQGAIEKHQLKELEIFAETISPVNRVLSGMSIRPSRTTDELTISFTGKKAADCPKVVNAIIEAYADMLESSHNEFSNETQRLLDHTRNELSKQLKDEEKKYDLFREESPIIWKADGKTNLFRERLQGIEGKKSALFLERTELAAELAAIQKALALGGSKEALRLMVGGLAEKKLQAGKGGATSIAGKLFPMLLEEEMLLETIGPDHPKVRNLHKRIELTRKFLQSSNFDIKKGDKPEKERDFIDVYLDSLRQQISLTQLKEEEFNKQLKVEREQIKKTIQIENKDRAFRGEIARIELLYSAMVKRLGEIKLVKDQGQFYIKNINQAGAGKQISPNFTRMMTIGGLLGFLVGAGFAFLRETFDKRFSAPEDIQQQLGAPVIGHVPHIPIKRRKKNALSQLDPSVCSFHLPKSKASEAFRAVRTSLYFSTHNANHQVLQVTSPNPGDGKSTLASNLAVSIACSGKQVLLLDCDFRKPRIHEIFGLPNDVGIATTITEGIEGEPLAYVQNTEIPNLWCMTCGKLPPNPSELLSSSIFEQFLEVAREKYDYVIVDTPPLLAVTDPSTVAARVDAVLITLKLKKNSRAMATRAREMLTAVGANLIGIVVNGAGHLEQYSYGYTGYGSSSYEQGYYGYNDGYGYGAKEERNSNQPLSVMYDSQKKAHLQESLYQDENNNET